MRANMKSAVSLFLPIVSLAAGGCNQPDPTCTVARGTFFANYTLVPGSVVGGDGSCGMLTGEEVYLNAFNQPKNAQDKNPSPSKIRISLQSSTLFNLVYTAGSLPEPVAPGDGDTTVGYGDFVSINPGKDDFCTVPTVSRAHVALPATAEMTDMPDQCTLNTYPPMDAVDMAYEWSNVRVYNTAEAIGTQFTADLTYTNNGCTAKYTVIAMFPSISCVNYMGTGMNPATDPDAGDSGLFQDAGLGGMDSGLPEDDAAVEENDATTEEDAGEEVDCGTPMEEEDPGTPFADDSLCTESLYINPDFMVKCDPVNMHCVQSTQPPSLK